MQHPSYRLMQDWLKKRSKSANWFDKTTGKVQSFVQSKIPDAIHNAITAGMEGFTKIVLQGSGFILPKLSEEIPFEIREKLAEEVIHKYVGMGMASGAGTSAGGIVTGLMDLPILMSLKIRMLFEIGAIFGYDLKEESERLYALMIFRTVFSSPLLREEKVQGLIAFETSKAHLEKPLDTIDWRAFQQEYRDYLDLAKLMQFIPGVGIVIGAAVNRSLLMALGDGAINAYRLRYFQQNPDKRKL